MSFTNLELQLIHKLVGEFCERRVPPKFKSQIRLTYSIDNPRVVISEERYVPNAPSGWVVLEIAKLTYTRARNEWQLYWKRANEKWWPYEPNASSKTLSALINEIDVDSDGCFFG